MKKETADAKRKRQGQESKARRLRVYVEELDRLRRKKGKEGRTGEK